MVKNELSIKAAESYKVSMTIANNKIKKISEKANTSMSALRTRRVFNSVAQDDKLQELRVLNLKKNIEALSLENKYQAEVVYYDGIKSEEKLLWSFVKLDRDNPDKEVVRKQIAIRRNQGVITDINRDKAEFNAKWEAYELKRDIEYKLHYDELKQSLYRENDAHLESCSYSSFHSSTVEKYSILSENMKQKAKEVMPFVLQAIDQAYDATVQNDLKIKIDELTNSMIVNYEQHLELSKQLIYLNVDLTILNQQVQEKLNVEDELKQCNETIAELKEKVSSIQKSIEEQNKKLHELYNTYNANKQAKVQVKIDNASPEQLILCQQVADTFALTSEKRFGEILKVIKNYLFEDYDFFTSFYRKCEKDYNEEVKLYRATTLKSLPKEIASKYKNENEYLAYINSNSSDENKSLLEGEKTSLNEKLAQAKDDFKKARENIAQGKKERIAEYKDKKANAKITLKNADSKKSSEVKEVVKLYKKEINAGQFGRYRSAFKNHLRNVSLIKHEHQVSKTKIMYPEAVSYKFQYQLQVKEGKKQRNIETKNTNKVLRKDLSLSKYRRNMNTKRRELILGYVFLSIWAIGFIVFTIVPIGYTILMSFSSVTYSNGYSKVIAFSFQSGLTFPSWTGKENFETLFLSDVNFVYMYIPQFFRSLLFYVPIVVFIGFVLALLLNTKIRGRTFFRIIYFLPVVIISGPVLSMLNNENSSGGSSIRLTLDGSAVATILSSISPKVLQYANEIFQNFVIILWMTGVPIVLFISALQKINRSLYEAAEIDGANKWQTLWAVTFPLIKSVMLIVTLFTIMQVTTINVSFVNPINAWLENRMSDTNNLGIAAIGAWAQTLVVLVFVLIAFLLFREKEFVVKQKSYEEMEEYKNKKAKRNAKISSFFHVNDIKNFSRKLVSPITKAINVAKENKKIKKESRGEK